MAAWAGGDWDSILRCGQPVLTVNGREFKFPAHPARQWVAALHSGDLEDVLPGLLHKDDWDDWADIYFDRERLFTPAMHERMNGLVVSHAAGMPLSAALRLVATAGAHWRDIDGKAALHGVQLLDLPFDRFCNTVLFILSDGAEDKARNKLHSQLTAPMRGWVSHNDEPVWDANENQDAFAALASMSRKS